MKTINNQSDAHEKFELKTEKPFIWLRSKEVRKMLGISDSSLQVMRNNGQIPTYKLGEMYFYNEDEINNVILSSKTSINKIK